MPQASSTAPFHLRVDQRDERLRVAGGQRLVGGTDSFDAHAVNLLRPRFLAARERIVPLTASAPNPSIRVDGRDIEPGAEARTDYTFSRRIYRTQHGISGQPDERWLRDALRNSHPLKTQPLRRRRRGGLRVAARHPRESRRETV